MQCSHQARGAGYSTLKTFLPVSKRLRVTSRVCKVIVLLFPRVSVVGVGSRVDGASGSAGALPAAAAVQDAGHQQHDGQHEQHTRDGDADGEFARGHAEVVVRRAGRRGRPGAHFWILGVGDFVDVQSGEDLDAKVADILLRLLQRGQVSLGLDVTPTTHVVAHVTAVGGHVVAAAAGLEAEPHIALVVDGRGVGELVRLEGHRGTGLVHRVLERAQDLVVHGTPLIVDKWLFAPVEAVSHETVGDSHAVGILVVDADDERERVSDLDVLGDHLLLGVADEDLHAAARHGRSGHQRRRAQHANVEEVGDGLLLGLITTPDVESAALVRHQLSVRLHHHCVEVLDAFVHFGAHGVARAQGQSVDDLVAHVAVLRHAGGVLGQALGVDHAIEVGRRLQGHLDVVAVALDVHVRRLPSFNFRGDGRVFLGSGTCCQERQ